MEGEAVDGAVAGERSALVAVVPWTCPVTGEPELCVGVTDGGPVCGEEPEGDVEFG